MESRSALVMAGLVAICIWPAGPVAASDFQFKPSLAVSEEYNDNIFEVPGDKRREFVTRVQPGAAIRYQTPVFDWDGLFGLEYRNYARGSSDDEINPSIALHGLTKLMENFLHVEVSESWQRVSLDVTRDTTKESPFFNQTDQNIATISPFLLWHIGDRSTLKTGYLYSDTRYSDAGGSAAVGTSGQGINKREHRGFAQFSREISSRLNFSADYSYRVVKTTPVRYDQQDVTGGFRYEYSDKSFVFGSIGNSWRNFSVGRNDSNLLWSAGILHAFDLTVVGLDTAVLFTEDPLTVSTKETSYTAKLDRVLSHGAVGVYTSYTDYVLTQSGISDHHQITLGGNGRLEVTPKLTGTVAVVGDKVTGSGTSVNQYPYHLSATAGLTYDCNYDISLALSYTYVTYRFKPESSTGGKDINRVVLEMRKVF